MTLSTQWTNDGWNCSQKLFQALKREKKKNDFYECILSMPCILRTSHKIRILIIKINNEKNINKPNYNGNGSGIIKNRFKWV